MVDNDNFATVYYTFVLETQHISMDKTDAVRVKVTLSVICVIVFAGLKTTLEHRLLDCIIA